MATRMQPSATHQQNTRQLYFIQRSKGMLTMPSTAISAELVGITQLQKPSPKLKARMAVYRVISMRSARGYDGHHRGGLPRTRRDDHVDQEVGDKHGRPLKDRWNPLQPLAQAVDDGVQHAAVREDA